MAVINFFIALQGEGKKKNLLKAEKCSLVLLVCSSCLMTHPFLKTKAKTLNNDDIVFDLRCEKESIKQIMQNKFCF